MTRTSRHVTVGLIATLGLAGIGWTVAADQAQPSTAILRGQDVAQGPAERTDDARRRRIASEVLEWNQIFIDTLIATNTANSSSQRLGAIVHTAIFDAYNGIDSATRHLRSQQRARRRVAPSGGHRCGVHGAGRPVPVPTAGAGCQLCGVARGVERRLRGPRRIAETTASCARRIERGIAWGTEVAQAVLAWRATDGFSASYPPFTGGTAVGQWRPTPPAFGPMSAQGLAFTDDVRPGQQHPVRAWTAANSDAAPRTRTISTPSRRSVARPARRALTIRQRSRCSGRAMPASTGIRPRTRLRAPTTCRCPTATGCSRC